MLLGAYLKLTEPAGSFMGKMACCIFHQAPPLNFRKIPAVTTYSDRTETNSSRPTEALYTEFFKRESPPKLSKREKLQE